MKRLQTSDTNVFVTFSYDEELALAKWVMDVLCFPWIDTKPQFHKLLVLIYDRKCDGRNIWESNVIDLIGYSKGYETLLPPLPALDEEESYISAPKTNRHGNLDKDARALYVRMEVTRAWKEVWETHPEIKKKVEGCEIFAGDRLLDPKAAKEHHEERQRAVETAFWKQVDRRQAEWELTREEAIQEVSDTHPRSEILTLRRDPKKA